MRRLLDTNVWIDAHAGRADACRVFTQARATQGAWIGAIIAATALLQQAEVVTRNVSDFKKVSGLVVLDTQSF